MRANRATIANMTDATITLPRYNIPDIPRIPCGCHHSKTRTDKKDESSSYEEFRKHASPRIR